MQSERVDLSACLEALPDGTVRGLSGAPRRPLILNVVNSLSAGGAEKQVLLAAQMLAGAGWTVWIIALNPDAGNSRIEKLVSCATSAGVRIFRPSRRGGRPMGLLLAAMNEVVLGATSPIIWSWGHRAEIIRAMLQVILPGSIGLCSLRSAHKQEIDRLAWLWRMLELQRPYYLSNSALNLELLQQHLLGIRPRAVVLYNAMESHALASAPVRLPAMITHLRVVMLGNIRIEIKGYDLVVNLAVEIRRRGLPVSITIGGSESEGLELRKMIHAAGVEDVIRLAGVVEQPEEFLRSGDAFLLMSRIEGMPNALIEAMCLGLPCISSKVGDLSRFTLDGENIRLVEVGDYSAVALILADWIRNWPRAVAQGLAGRELCQKLFAPSVIGQQLDETMSKLADIHNRKVVL
jgi:glycosyltransferase involved in cell wall biosynthesis